MEIGYKGVHESKKVGNRCSRGLEGVTEDEASRAWLLYTSKG